MATTRALAPASASIVSRRGAMATAAAAATAAALAAGAPGGGAAWAATAEEAAALAKSRYYPLWWVLPLAPYGNKTTVRTELVPGRVWGFEQLQGILYVLVNIRMTVVKLEGGGLWIHNPIAPTPEMIGLVRELEQAHGPVKYVVLGSAAIEHKWNLGPFVKKFPQAEIWAVPGQWSFPLNLGLSELGLFPRQLTGVLPRTSEDWKAPWGDEIEHEWLGVGGSILTGFDAPWFVDCAFYHAPTKTVLVTDAVQSVNSGEPPAVAQVDPYPLLLRAQNGPDDIREDTPENRREGWKKTLLFGLLFKPEAVDVRFTGNLAKDLRE